MEDFSGSDTHSIMTITRAIYQKVDTFTTTKTGAAPNNLHPSPSTRLIGVVAMDLNLNNLKDILDTVSDNLGRTSFPFLVTPFG